MPKRFNRIKVCDMRKFNSDPSDSGSFCLKPQLFTYILMLSLQKTASFKQFSLCHWKERQQNNHTVHSGDTETCLLLVFCECFHFYCLQTISNFHVCVFSHQKSSSASCTGHTSPAKQSPFFKIKGVWTACAQLVIFYTKTWVEYISSISSTHVIIAAFQTRLKKK